MARRLISSGSTFEKSIGYSRAVVDGEWVFVSGTTGFDYGTMTIQDDAVAQCEQALRNIEAALKQAGSGFADVVRVHYLMTNAADFERCWPAMGQAFGAIRPAATMMVVGLADPRMKIEIEVTALRRQSASVSRAAAAAKPKAAPRGKAKAKAKATRRKK
jgi:enamine deaminase RidA (YjgF/YER057c/UK114 family)